MPSKKKKIVSLFFVKAGPKKGTKVFSCEAAADLVSSNKGSFFNQDEWLHANEYMKDHIFELRRKIGFYD